MHKIKKDNYICHATYLRNNIVYDHGFWYTCVKWWYVQGFFYIFIFWAVMQVKGQKIAQNEKWQLYLSCNLPQEQCSLWSWLLVHLCKMIICPSGLFYIFIFWAVMGVKGQEMAQNAKKKCLLHFISQEPYILWLSFIVDFCKMMISSGLFFHFFEILIFQAFRGG